MEKILILLFVVCLSALAEEPHVLPEAQPSAGTPGAAANPAPISEDNIWENLADPSPKIRLAAAEQFANLPRTVLDSPARVNQLFKLLDAEKDAKIRTKMAVALGRFKGEQEDVVDKELKMLKKETDPNVRSALLIALLPAVSKSAAVQDTVAEHALSDSSAQTRFIAVRVLAEHATESPEFGVSMARAALDKDQKVSAAAFAALSHTEISDPEVVAILEKHFPDLLAERKKEPEGEKAISLAAAIGKMCEANPPKEDFVAIKKMLKGTGKASLTAFQWAVLKKLNQLGRDSAKDCVQYLFDALALTPILDPTVQKKFIELARNFRMPGEVRARALKTFPQMLFENPEIESSALDVAEVALYSKDAAAREAAIQAMSELNIPGGRQGNLKTEINALIAKATDVNVKASLTKALDDLHREKLNGLFSSYANTKDVREAMRILDRLASGDIPVQPKTLYWLMDQLFDHPKFDVLKKKVAFQLASMALSDQTHTVDYPLIRSSMNLLKTEPVGEIRKVAPDILMGLAGDDPTTVKTVLEYLKNDKDAYVRAHCALALADAKVDKKEATDAILNTLEKDSSPVARNYAAVALGKLKNSDPKIVTALVRMLTKGGDDERNYAASALANIKPPGPEAMNKIIAMVKGDPEKANRVVAIGALATLGGDQPAVVSPLLDRMEHGSVDEATASASNLAKLRSTDGRVMPALAALLKKSDPQLRTAGAAALGELRERAKGQVGTLLDLLGHDAEKSVRFGAAEALEAIDGNNPKVIEAVKKYRAAAGSQNQF